MSTSITRAPGCPRSIGVDLIHQRVSMLTGWLLECLGRMRHSTGAPMVRLYGPSSVEARGGTVALNFLDPAGRVVDERAVGRDAAEAGISLRTGCFCNPGAGERAFGLTREVLRARRLRAAGAGMSSVDDYLSLVGLPTGGGPGVPRRRLDAGRRGGVPRLRRAQLPRPLARHGGAVPAPQLLSRGPWPGPRPQNST